MAGSIPLQVWPTGAVARFVPVGPATVTVSSVVAEGIVFDGAGYTLAGGDITLGASGVIANASATLRSSVAGTNGLLKSGAGILTFAGEALYEGTTSIEEGVLKLDISDEVVTPALSADCVMWLRADTGVVTDVNGYVTNWVDQSGSGNHATQSGASSRPLLLPGVLNGRQVVRFDGSNDNLFFDGGIVVNTDYTLIIVEGRRSNKSNNYFMRGSTRATDKNLHVGYRNNTTFTHDQYATGFNMTVPGYGSQEFVTLAVIHDGVAGKEVWRNGSSLSNKVHTAPLSAYANAALGGYASGNFYNGDIAEFLIFNRALGTAEREELEAYLMTKWDLQGSNNTAMAVADQAALDLNGNNRRVLSLDDLSGAGGVVSNSSASPATLTVVGGGSAAFSGVITDGTGAVSLVKSDVGIQTLTGDNTYSGSTLIGAGTLQIGAGGTNGVLSPGHFHIGAGAQLTVNRSDPVTLTNDFRGRGTIYKAGGNALTVADSAWFGGNIKLGGGTFTLPAGTSIIGLGEASSDQYKSATWNLEGPFTAQTFRTVTTGGGTHYATYTVTVNADADFTVGNFYGAFSGRNSGKSLTRLNVGSNSAATIDVMELSWTGYCQNTTAESEININGVLNVNSLLGKTSDSRVSGKKHNRYININPGGRLNATTINLSHEGDSESSYTRRLTISDGTLANLPGGNLSVDAKTPIVLTGRGVIDVSTGYTGTVNGVVQSDGDLIKIGEGTLELAGAANTYTGDTVVSNGTLSVAHSWLGGSNATLRIESGATVSLASNVNAVVQELYLGRRQHQAGTWGGIDSAAVYKRSGSFSGAGIVTVLEGAFPATIFSVR